MGTLPNVPAMNMGNQNTYDKFMSMNYTHDANGNVIGASYPSSPNNGGGSLKAGPSYAPSWGTSIQNESLALAPVTELSDYFAIRRSENAKEGSNMLQLVPPSSNFNPTGAGGVNPNVYNETLNSQGGFVPGNAKLATPSLGVGNGSPFNYGTNPPAPAVQQNPTISPNGSIYGHSVAPTNTNIQALTPGTGTLDPSLVKALDKTYGKGFGNSIYNVLKSGAGFNPQVANAFINAVHPYFEENMNQLLESFAASGQRFSSTAALAAGKYTADFTSQQQAFLGQMYQTAYNSFLNTLIGVGSKNTSGTLMGTIRSILGMVGTGADALSATGIGDNNKTLDNILAGLGAL